MTPIYHDILLDVPLYCAFTYAHDCALPAGQRVAVRFRGKLVAGLVQAADVGPKIDVRKIKPIETVFPEPPLPQDWRDLAAFAAKYYLYPPGAAAFAALAAELRRPKAFTLPEKKAELFYTLDDGARDEDAPQARYPKLAALWQALRSGSLSAAEARKIHPQAQKYLSLWQEKGWLKSVENIPPQTTAAAELNAAQSAALQAVAAAQDSFAPFLLFGVTGSGKTEVYLEAAAETLARGRQVLLLVPEINLTPQLLARLRARFMHLDYAVINSRTAPVARTRHFLYAAAGDVPLVVGTRMAVFTPFARLGLIIVDEEHDTSFKQDSELRYHARDLAVWRAKAAGCPVILGSATPSLESFQAALNGRYRLLRLPERANAAAKMPEIVLDDVRRQKLNNGFGRNAEILLKNNVRAGGLSLVYINRRGYAPALGCTACGQVFSCPNCSAKLVLHLKARQLRCHHCDYRTAQPQTCPDCQNSELTAFGQGTQRVEDTLRAMLPQAVVERIDSDNTTRKDDWTHFDARIRAGEIHVIVGTQMLAKGHDFDRLNLVVVVNADGGLYSADLRAPERLFAELMQVSGRAGRAQMPGRVLIQTQLPDNPLFAALQKQDYESFARSQLAQRVQYAVPPAVYAAALRADAPDLDDALAFLRAGLDACRTQKTDANAAENDRTLPENVAVYGPVPQTMVRLAGRERAQIFLESPDRNALHRAAVLMLRQMAAHAARWRDLRYFADIDPLES